MFGLLKEREGGREAGREGWREREWVPWVITRTQTNKQTNQPRHTYTRTNKLALYILTNRGRGEVFCKQGKRNNKKLNQKKNYNNKQVVEIIGRKKNVQTKMQTKRKKKN